MQSHLTKGHNSLKDATNLPFESPRAYQQSIPEANKRMSACQQRLF